MLETMSETGPSISDADLAQLEDLIRAPLPKSYRQFLGCVDKLNPDADAGKQHEGGEALDQLVVAGGDAA
jgi:hypothetical protein